MNHYQHLCGILLPLFFSLNPNFIENCSPHSCIFNASGEFHIWNNCWIISIEYFCTVFWCIEVPTSCTFAYDPIVLIALLLFK